MKKEIQLLKKWLEAPGELRVKPDPIVDKILSEPEIREEYETDTAMVMGCQDSTKDLVEIFAKITRPNKLEFIKQLHLYRGNFLSNGKPLWVSRQDIPKLLNINKIPHRRLGYPAWVLSNHRGSGQYFGEWFERSGKRQKDGKFRTTKYRLRPEAIEALDRIFGR